MDELKTAMNDHLDQMQEIIEKISSELRVGMQPAVDNFVGFFHAIDWKEPWLVGLMVFHFMVLITIIASRKNINFQMYLFLLSLAGVYLAERLNSVLSDNWKSFAGQNYFDRHGVFLSVLWSGPLLVFATIILVNTLFSLCHLIVKWKRAELKHRARLSSTKQD
uniref:transmembrane protein 18 n=1 Tax=Erigeron canadensis TaxID=72917 RepID=UPI001CB9D39F|nr:transmembrane protein 18 [Erigeron canadensis]